VASRFYLPTGTAGETTVGVVPSGWTAPTEGSLTRQLNRVPGGTTINGLTVSEATASVTNILGFKYISSILEAQTISGTFSAVYRALESVTTADLAMQVGLYIVPSDGSSVSGTLYAGLAAALNATVGALGQELATTSQTRIMPSTAISSYTCAAGDRLLVCLGYRTYNTSSTSVNAVIRLGDNAASDFALTSGLTTDLNPWVELSADLVFRKRQVSVNQSVNRAAVI